MMEVLPVGRRKPDSGLSQETIVEAATSVLKDKYLTDWTVDYVASQAGCAKGLVLYHFKSKEALLGRVAERVRESQSSRRAEAMAKAQGSASLDRLWQVLVADVKSGAFGLWVGLLGEERTRKTAARRPEDDKELLLGASTALGVPGDSLALPLVPAALDGFSLELLQGRPPATVRERYDAFWLGVLSDAS